MLKYNCGIQIHSKRAFKLIHLNLFRISLSCRMGLVNTLKIRLLPERKLGGPSETSENVAVSFSCGVFHVFTRMVGSKSFTPSIKIVWKL